MVRGNWPAEDGFDGFSGVPTVSQHLRLDQPSPCILCGFPVWSGDTVAAVMGEWACPTFCAFTLGFKYPSGGWDVANIEYTNVYRNRLKDAPCPGAAACAPWILCRSSSCTQCSPNYETFIYHTDCWSMLKQHGTRPWSIQDIWTIAKWTKGLSDVNYHVWPAHYGPLLKGVVAGLDPVVSMMKALPIELHCVVAQYCMEATLWRFLSALYRQTAFEPLLTGNLPQREVPLARIRRWDRRTGDLFLQSLDEVKPESQFRMRLDDMGVSQVDYVEDDPEPDRTKASYTMPWWVVEKMSDMGDILSIVVEVKGPFMRIKSKTQTRWQLWDTPNPPPRPHSWEPGDPETKRIRTMKIEGITGLTAFCLDGRPMWFWPHYDPYLRDLELPPQRTLHPSERKRFVAMHFPLAHGETIEDIWIRYFTDPHDEFPQPIISTNLGRAQIFGDYEDPADPYLRFKPLTRKDQQITHILFPDPDSGLDAVEHLSVITACASRSSPHTTMSQSPSTASPASFSCAPRATSSAPQQPSESFPQLPPILTKTIPRPDGQNYRDFPYEHYDKDRWYLSVATLTDVASVQLFLGDRMSSNPTGQPRPAACPPSSSSTYPATATTARHWTHEKRVCLGMTLRYYDGSTASLGCLGNVKMSWHSTQIVHYPSSLYFRNIPGGEGLEVMFTSSILGADPQPGGQGQAGDGWRRMSMVGDVCWWFDDYKTIQIGHA